MKFYLSVFCLMNVITVVKSAKLNIRPSTNIQAGEPNLTVRCQPTPSAFLTSVYQLDLLRLREGVSSEQILGTIKAGKQPELGPGLTIPKYSVSGSLTADVSTYFLQIVIQNPNSKDAGTYGCNVTGRASGGGSYKGSANLDVRVQGSGAEGVINSGSVVFLLVASFINLILNYL